MNELSWLIYLAEVGGDINFVCATILTMGPVALGVYAIAKGICRIANYEYDEEPKTPSIASVSRVLWLPIVIAAVVGVVVPSQQTLYAIAASELGETVIESETGGKAVEALNAWLDRQISGQKEAAE